MALKNRIENQDTDMWLASVVTVNILKTEAESSLRMSKNIYQTPRCYASEGFILHIHRRIYINGSVTDKHMERKGNWHNIQCFHFSPLVHGAESFLRN